MTRADFLASPATRHNLYRALQRLARPSERDDRGEQWAPSRAADVHDDVLDLLGTPLPRGPLDHRLKRTWKWSLWPFQWRMIPKLRPFPRGYWNSSSSVLSLTFCLRACS
jgi:hypothetical protein